MTQAYCVKCRAKKDMKNEQKITPDEKAEKQEAKTDKEEKKPKTVKKEKKKPADKTETSRLMVAGTPRQRRQIQRHLRRLPADNNTNHSRLQRNDLQPVRHPSAQS
mgnify:CR=1 FL=1